MKNKTINGYKLSPLFQGYLFIIILLLHNWSYSANACSTPEWYNLINETSKENCYFQGHGIGKSPTDAANTAWSNVIQQIGISNTKQISSEIKKTWTLLNDVQIDSIVEKSEAKGYVDAQGETLMNILAKQTSGLLCDDGFYHYYLLVGLNQPNCQVSLIYPSNNLAALRSFAVPGLGQMYKGNTKRGISFTSTTLLLAGATITAFILSSQNQQRAANSLTVPTRNYYTSWRDGTYYAGIGLSIGTAGIYLWNIFDAKNLKGTPKIK